jgi:hypothetical protein
MSDNAVAKKHGLSHKNVAQGFRMNPRKGYPIIESEHAKRKRENSFRNQPVTQDPIITKLLDAWHKAQSALSQGH